MGGNTTVAVTAKVVVVDAVGLGEVTQTEFGGQSRNRTECWRWEEWPKE